MANDNTLGAPTEGLGQTVTFATQGGGGTPQTGSDQRQAVRNNPGQGGARLTAQALQVPPSQPNATFAALMKLGGELIEPHIKQARTEAYVKGMQQAAQGEAITDIVEEQPWYSKVFGPTSLVDGARAWTASTAATNTAVRLEEEMPELRKLSASEFNKHVAGSVLKSNTGDATTDALVMHQLSQQLPGVMRAQAKNHLAYQNELAAETLGASQLAQATLLGTVSAKARSAQRPTLGPLPEGDVAADGAVLDAELRLSEQFSRVPPGMDKEVHQKITASTVAKALSAGNFAAYDVLDRSGQLDKLEPSVAAVIRVAHRAARAEARVKLPLEFAKEEADLIALSVNPRATREALTLGTEALNAKYRRFTGDPGKYRDSADLARDMVRLDATYRQEQAELERQRKEATSHMQKEAIKLQEIDATVERLRTGRSVDASAESQTIAWGVLGAKNPEVVNFARVRGAGGYPPVIDVAFKDELQRTVGEAKAVVTAEDAAKGLIKPEARPLMFHEAYAKMYLPLVQAAGDKDQEVALAYAGPHGEALSKYHSFFIGRAPSTITEEQKIVAYQNAIREEPKKSDPKTVKAIAEALANNAWFDEDQMPIVHSEELAKILAPHSVSTASAENKASQAQSALADKLSVVGGHYWWKSAGATDIKDYWVMQANKLPPGEDTRGVITGSEHNRAMRNAVDQLAVEAGLDPATVIVHQGSDLNGVPQFIIKGADSKQNAVLLGLPAEAITARWLKKENRMTKAKFEEAERLVKTGPGFVNGKFDPFAKPN